MSTDTAVPQTPSGGRHADDSCVWPSSLALRRPDGDLVRIVSAEQARTLIGGGIARAMVSGGHVRYVQLHRSPVARGYAALVAEASTTTTRTALLHEHRSSRRKGL